MEPGWMEIFIYSKSGGYDLKPDVFRTGGLGVGIGKKDRFFPPVYHNYDNYHIYTYSSSESRMFKP